VRDLTGVCRYGRIGFGSGVNARAAGRCVSRMLVASGLLVLEHLISEAVHVVVVVLDLNSALA